MKKCFRIFFVALIALVTIGLIGQFLANAGIFEALTGIKDAITGLNGTVIGTPSIEVTVDCDCGDHHHDGNCVEDTENCDHVYTVWHSEYHHWKQCEKCGHRGKEVAHSKPCTQCGYGVETTVSCTHKWGSCCNNGWKCTLCGTLNHVKCHNHTWANCCANGKYCTGCGYKNHTCVTTAPTTTAPAPETTAPAPETTAPHTHSYSWKSNANQHWKQCDCGTTTGKANHTFADGECTVCGRDCSHNWVDCCKNGRECTKCGKKNHTSCYTHTHSYSIKCCENGKKCSCGVKNHTACHTHNYVLQSNSTYHWYICACNPSVAYGKANHTFIDGACTVCGKACTHNWVTCCEAGRKCSVCGQKNHASCYTHVHSYNTICCENGNKCSCGMKNHTVCHMHNYQLQSNADYHWYICSCNTTVAYGRSGHTYNSNGVCTVCGQAKQVASTQQKCTNCNGTDHTVANCPYCTSCQVRKEYGHASDCIYNTGNQGGTTSGYCSECQMNTVYGHANGCSKASSSSGSTGRGYDDWP